MGNLTFDNTTLSSFGVVVSGEKSFNAPERDVESIEIPGRNGDLIIDNGRYRNRRLVYPAFIYKNTTANVASLRSFLASHSAGYYRLTDSYDTEHFIMARYSANVEFEMHNLNRSAHTNLTFDCKPQRFLLSGEVEQTVINGGTIANQTMFDAMPIIHVTNAESGAILTVNGFDISFVENATGYIDCEIENAFNGMLNSDISCGNFPVLSPGSNSVSWVGTIESVQIIPRWWEI